jgi:hypothetical protein
MLHFPPLIFLPNTILWTVQIMNLLDVYSLPLLPASYEGVSKTFRTGRPERELQMVQLSATICSCISILWVSLVIFAVITLCIAFQRVFFCCYFVIDSVRKLLDITSYIQIKFSTLHYSNTLRLCVNRYAECQRKNFVTLFIAKLNIHLCTLLWNSYLGQGSGSPFWYKIAIFESDRLPVAGLMNTVGLITNAIKR